MKNVRRIRIGLVACLVASGLAVPSTSIVSARTGADKQGPSEQDDSWRAVASSTVGTAEVAPDANPAPRLDEALIASRRTESTATVTVEVVGAQAAVASAVDAAGGTLGRGGGGLWLATVPGTGLRALAAAAGVTHVRVPETFNHSNTERALPERGSFDNQVDNNVKQWHRAGFDGSGVKVGIIGLFDLNYLNAEIGYGELPNVPAGNRICITSAASCPFGTPNQTWGNSLAEMVADSAPNASLYLAELGVRSDYYNVIDWMASNGVTIVVNPIIWTYDGPGNGTGPSAAIVNYAVSKGIAWFNTAGELSKDPAYVSFAGGYWRGSWRDPDNDRWLNFNGTDESESAYCGYLLGLRWSDWGPNPTDYDLYISDYNATTRGNGAKKLLSGTVQPAGGGSPLEGTSGVALCNTNPAYGPVYDTNKDGFVSLWVQRKSTSSAAGAAGDTIEIGAAYGWLEYASSPGSASIAFADSANPGESTVGASAGELVRGSLGPTNDGRVKPDVTQLSCNSTWPHGVANYNCSTGYFGTDGAAAVVAGYAAVAQQALGIPNPSALMLYIRDNSAAPDGSYYPAVDGGGIARMSYYPPPTSYPAGVFKAADTPFRLVDTRTGVGAPKGTLKARQTLHVFIPNMPPEYPFAMVLNVVLVNPTANGWLEAYPHGWSYQGASSILNADAGHNRANVVIVPANQNQIDIYTSGGGDIVVDYLGGIVYHDTYPSNPNNWGPGRFQPLHPFRYADSRTCIGIAPCTAQPLAAGSYTDIHLAGAADPASPTNAIPVDARTVAFSLTVDSPAAKGYASVIPGGQSAITTSNLNFDAGGSATTLVLAKLDSSGTARIFLSQSAHVQVDVLGWFTSATGVQDQYGRFVPLTPARGIDTRQPPNTKPAAGSHVAVDLTSKGVPTTAIAAFVNNISVQSAATGEFNVAAIAPPDPSAFRNLSYSTVGRPIAAATISRLNAGSLVVTPSAESHVVTDLAGYFVGSTTPPPPAGAIRNIAHAPDGAAADAPANLIELSHSGQAALFTSTATNLDLTPSGSHLFLWRSVDDSVVELPVGSAVADLSDDGDVVAFATTDALLPADTDATLDVYAYRVSTDELTLASQGVTEALTNGPVLSNDGRYVWFWGNVGSPSNLNVWRYDLVTATLLLTATSATATVAVPAGNGNTVIEVTPSETSCVVTTVTVAPASSTVNTPNLPCSNLDFVTTTDGSTLIGRAYGGHAIVRIGAVSQLQFSEYYGAQTAVADDGAHLLFSGQEGRLYVYRFTDGTRSAVDRTFDGAPLNSAFSGYDMSGDARFVAFSTEASNMFLAISPHGGIYLVDRSLLPV